ncbi:energy transducer TonB [Ferruginibacter sp. SUN002]|uniref:energy transducer TonB n=1 Tax=Ferruginibacter sp. SUN002 TaxID=2937789 RepID=UPI003D35F0FC
MKKIMLLSVLIVLASKNIHAQDGYGTPPPPPSGAPGSQDVYDTPFTKVEIDESFPGGDGAWKRYLNRNINTKVPIKKRAKKGTYKVEVEFWVAKNGAVDSVVAKSNNGYGMEEEVVRVIKKSPSWSPGQQNGRNVKKKRSETFVFIVKKRRLF